ncbi:MAG: C40 family peptidase [Paenibacillaceae bacterium]
MISNRIGKGIIAITIGFSLLFSATVTILPQKAEAAYSVSKANAIISNGKSYWGRAYQFGASTSTTRVFDCSSFTKRLYAKQGIYLPRSSKDQAKQGYYVSKKNLKKGDLVFFSTSGSGGRIAHVAIYAGNGKILHTYKKGVGVTMTKLNKSFWKQHYKTARRVIR